MRSTQPSVDFRDMEGGKVQLRFSDSRRTVTLDLSGLMVDQKIARIRAQILNEGYFYSQKIEKELYRWFGLKPPS